MPGRSLTTGLTLAACVAALIVLRALVIGADRDLKELFLSTSYPDVYILAKDYEGFSKGKLHGPLHNLIAESSKVQKAIEEEELVTVVAPRLKFAARLSDGLDLVPCQIMAGIPSRERKLFPEIKLVSGRWLTDEDRDRALIGTHLARSMDLKLGSSITLLAQSGEGALSAIDVEIVGTTYSGNPYADGFIVFLPLDTGRQLAEVGDDETSVFLLRTKSQQDFYPDLAKGPSEKCGQELISMSWYERTKWMRELTARRSAGVAVAGMFMALTVIIGVANALLMSAYERRREIGTLYAMGFYRSDIVSLFVMEGTCLGFIGSLFGAAIGTLGALYYEVEGIAIESDPATLLSFMPNKIYALLTPDSVIYAFFFGLLVVTLSSFYPAIQGSSLLPAEALRK